ncbi:MAG TPA: 50S ribosomal protein L17 [Patescibacteria group bacterium]|nr:50S ribosomal protein L17 [Patescibacteria group bacterium]
MRHQKKGKTLGRKAAPRRAMMRSLATSFIIYEKIKTTEAKARLLKPKVEKLITVSKEDTLHNRRQALKVLYLQGAVKKLFEVIGPRFKERKGGYTRLVKLPPRKNDGAEMAILELVDKD